MMSMGAESSSPATTCRIKPSIEPLLYLGGALSGCRLPPPPNMNSAAAPVAVAPDAANATTNAARDAYAALQLPRPIKLLPPPFMLKTKDEAVRTAFMKIWDGDFVATWVLDYDDKGIGRLVISGGPAVSDDGDDTLSGSSLPLPAELRGPLIQVVLSYSTTTIMDEQIICQEQYPNFAAALNKEKMKAALCHRMLHHVVRTNGFRLPGGQNNNGHSAFEHACRALTTLYTGGRAWQGLEKCYHSALDAAIIAADLAICMENTSIKQTLPWLHVVGEHLEAVENYAQAAKVYVYAVDNFTTIPYCAIDQCVLYCNAGLAFKRDGQLIDAEECYIQALGACFVVNGVGMDLNHIDTTNLINNLITLYDQQNQAMPPDMFGDDKTFYGFLALLYAACFKPAGRGDCWDRVRYLLNKLGSPLSRVALPLEYQTQDAAKRILYLAAVKTTTATATWSRRLHFQAIISAIMPDVIPLPITRTGIFEADDMHRQAEAARQVVDIVCANPSCTTVNNTNSISSNAGDASFKACPCRSAFYCQKSCQIAHWPVHKMKCPQRKTQQDKKKNQISSTSG